MKKIIVPLRDGIGSRILKIGFSLTLAKKLGRELEFVWHQNWQCGNNSQMDDFFQGELSTVTIISEAEESRKLRHTIEGQTITINSDTPKRLSLLELDKFELIYLANSVRRKIGDLTEVNELKQLATSEIRNLNLSKKLSNEIEQFSEATFKGKVLGVHIRGGDIRQLAENNNGNKSAAASRYIPVESFIEKLNEIHNDFDTVFLSAEDEDHLEAVKELLPDKIVYRSKPHGRESVKHIQEALIEIYLLSKCDFLLLGNSKFSKLAVELGNVPFESLGRTNKQSIKPKPRIMGYCSTIMQYAKNLFCPGKV